MPERFEIYDEHGVRLGVADRQRVHREGLWHRAAHVWLFGPTGLLWIQRRANDKDICPGCWDFSVGEHLRPGESFLAAAVRGLREELAVDGVVLAPLGPPRRARHDDAERGIHDYEETQAFRGIYDGEPRADAVEVVAVRAIALPALAQWLAHTPADFTPWFRAEAAHYRLLPDAC
jgi:isopentenyldiphosphate isomerase